MKHTKKLVLSVFALVSANSSAAMAAGRVGKCEALFQSVQKEVVAKTGTGVALAKRSSTEVVVDDVPMYIKERIVLEGGLRTYVRSSQIPESHAVSVDRKARTADGEFVAVSFLTELQSVLPSSSVNAQLGYSSQSQARLGSAQSGARHAVAVVAPRTVTVAEVQKMGLNPVEILTNFIRKETVDTQLDARSLTYIVETMQKSPEYMAQALAYHQSRSLRPEGSVVNRPVVQSAAHGVVVNLANTGSYRYFRFTPRGESQEVIARVLDINQEAAHSGSSGAGFHVLVEWMKPANSSDVRVRNVQTLSVEELRTMRPLSDSIRRVIAEEFNDALSPNEIKTRKLAELANLKTFGYTDMSRKEGGSERSTDPLSRMSMPSHIKSRSDVQERFGKFDDLLTTDEANAGIHWRIFDVMARLNPRYILKRFESRGTGFRYVFVITEDGQLKISPFTEAEANFRPEILRLAHGRRIFAGGEFTIAKDGKLDVNLRSDEYQDINAEYGVHRAFQTEGQDGLNSFVAFTFGLQAGRAVNNLSSEFARTFYTERGFRPEGKDDLGGDRYAHDSFFKAFSGDRRETNGRFGGFGSQGAFNHAREAMQEVNLARNVEVRKFVESKPWKDAEGPPTFAAWQSKTQDGLLKILRNKLGMTMSAADLAREPAFKQLWAHAVLRTNSEMSLDAIKSSYRRLANAYHPDRRADLPEPVARALFQATKEAFETIESGLKQ